MLVSCEGICKELGGGVICEDKNKDNGEDDKEGEEEEDDEGEKTGKFEGCGIRSDNHKRGEVG